MILRVSKAELERLSVGRIKLIDRRTIIQFVVTTELVYGL